MLESVPPSIFNIPNLEMLNLDRNHLMDLPSSVSVTYSTVQYSTVQYSTV